MKIGEMFVQLGVKADTFTVKDFVSSLGQIPFSAATAVASLAGMSLGFADMFKNTLDTGNALAMFRSQTGLSTDELQRWQGVAKQVGMSGDTITSSIMGINSALAQLRLGNGAALLPLSRMGVYGPLGKNAFQILQEIGQNKTHLSPSMQTALMGQVGVAPEMMRIFGLSSNQFSRMAAQGQMMSTSDIDAMNEFQEALGRFELTIRRDFVPAIVGVEPYLKDFADVIGALITNVVGPGIKLMGTTARWYNDKTQHFPGLSAIAGAVPHGPLYYGGDRMFDVSVTNHIHSTADAEEVAVIAGHHVSRAMVKAAKAFDNMGY